LLVKQLDGRGATRDQICDAVWGKTADSTNRFHIALNRLRNALRGDKSTSKSEPHYIVHEDGVYSLIDTGIWCDVREFDRLLKRADKEKQAKAALRLQRTAFDLYEGDFLAGLEQSWVEAYRESYRQRFSHTGVSLAEAALTDEQFEDAEQIAQKMIACDPHGVDGHRLLITVYMDTGRRKQAKDQINTSRNLFQRIGDSDAVLELEALLDDDEASARRRRRKNPKL
jgi:DNA-binding SARP family transcriptional activator